MLKVSVIVPVFQSSDHLWGCLTSLAEQTIAPTDFEVILIDCTSAGIENWFINRTFPYLIKLVRHQADKLAIGLNQAVELAKGEYCLFLDSHLRATPGLISEHFRTQQFKGGIVGQGNIQILSNRGGKWYSASYTKSRNNGSPHFGTDSDVSPSWIDLKIKNLSIPRDRILKLGGLSGDFAHNCSLELGFRLKEQGAVFMHIETAVGLLQDIPPLQDLSQEEEEHGIACVELWRLKPKQLAMLLGSFYNTSPRAILLRRILLETNLSSSWLGRVGPLIVNPDWREKWYLFWQQYAFWRGVRAALRDRETWRQLTHGIPILMYHAFGYSSEQASRYVLPIGKFKIHMWLLKRLGYRVIGLTDYVNCLEEGQLPPENSVIITIDDGYADNYSLAYPVLKQFKLPATIFLVSTRLGKVNDWDEGSVLTGRPLFDLQHAKEMHNALVTFGAHTRSHPWLSNLPLEQVRKEIMISKLELERKLGKEVRMFSYPHGDYDKNMIAIVEQAGYSGACSTDTGLNTPGSSRYTLRRVEIYGTFSFFQFLRAVRTGK